MDQPAKGDAGDQGLAPLPGHRTTSLRQNRRRPLFVSDHPETVRQLLPKGAIASVPFPLPVVGYVAKPDRAELMVSGADEFTRSAGS